MDVQFIIAVGIGILAVLYIGFRFTKQLNEVEKNSKCNDCPVINVVDRD